MLKDKITPQLKNRFIEDIQDTIRDGNERGFLICTDEKGKLSATQSCQGMGCSVSLKSLGGQCLTKIQGDFHTHPHAGHTRQYLKEILGRDVPLEDAKKVIVSIAKDRNISIEGPSYGDILGTIGLRYTNETLGTTCVGSDINPDRIECWSTKEEIKEKDVDMAMAELDGPYVNNVPREWVKPLFDIEKIDLKKDNLEGDEMNGR